MKNISKQQGFTLIELIVVIVILGILAVTAAPKFMNFTGDARKSTMSGLLASVKGAAQLTNAAALVASKTSTTGTESVDGVLLAYGYPVGTKAVMDVAAGIASATDGASDYTVIEDGTVTNTVWYYPASIYNATLPLTKLTVEAGACYVKYVEPAALAGTPTITSALTGCES